MAIVRRDELLEGRGRAHHQMLSVLSSTTNNFAVSDGIRVAMEMARYFWVTCKVPKTMKTILKVNADDVDGDGDGGGPENGQRDAQRQGEGHGKWDSRDRRQSRDGDGDGDGVVAFRDARSSKGIHSSNGRRNRHQRVAKQIATSKIGRKDTS